MLGVMIGVGLVSQAVAASPSLPAADPPVWLAQQASDERDQSGLSREEAARQVREQYAGRILSIRQVEGGWRVRLLKDGEVRTVIVR
jgi:hypothetical protein